MKFGAKIADSIVNGYTFIDHFSFVAYNEGESTELERVVEKYLSVLDVIPNGF